MNYFIWDLVKGVSAADEAVAPAAPVPSAKTENSEFIHNDIRDKLVAIGNWLGFEAKAERKVAAGSVVDAVWESTIGNMGRVV